MARAGRNDGGLGVPTMTQLYFEAEQITPVRAVLLWLAAEVLVDHVRRYDSGTPLARGT